jgi:hypothetical protein
MVVNVQLKKSPHQIYCEAQCSDQNKLSWLATAIRLDHISVVEPQ